MPVFWLSHQVITLYKKANVFAKRYDHGTSLVRVIKSRRMRWAGHVARVAEGRGVHMVLVGKPEGNSHLGDPGLDGRIILTHSLPAI